MRAVDFDADRLIGPSGTPVPGERTLTYFITHEIMHTLIADELGALAYWRLPDWKDEGYSDHVAKGASFHFDHAIEQLRSGDREMDPRRSGLYLRYNLLVAYLLEQKGISVHEMLNQEFEPVESRGRNVGWETWISDRVEQIKKAFQADDADRVRELLDSHPELKAKINEPLGPFDSPADRQRP